jgi:hypothetical protein
VRGDVPKGQPVPPVDADNAKRSLPMSTTSMPETNPRTGRFSPLAWMGIVVGILLAIVKALIWSKGVLNAEVFGYALAGAVVPGAIAYAIAGRAKVRNSNRFALWFLLLCVFFLSLELSHRMR